MAERIALVDMAAGFADHENQLAFIVELLRRTRPHNRAIVPDERTGKANEQRRITRRRCAIAIFPGPVGIVDADAEDPRIGADRRPERESARRQIGRSEEHTSELQSLMRISYAVFCLKKKKHQIQNT